MEDHRTAARLIPEQGFMATVDLKEAYLLIPMAECSQKYLRFHFEDDHSDIVTFEFKAMPYGLSVAPRTFTKIMREVMTHLRSQGHKSIFYLDDILCIGDDYDECSRNRLHNYDRKINLPKVILEDLNWWKDQIPSSSCSMLVPDYSLIIYSDASRTGWGGFCNNIRTHGAWRIEEKEFHINQLELLAAFLALKYFSQDERNCTILLRIDNTTAISYINRMGGVQFPHLNELARQIWQWCEKRNIWLFASYINTKDNVEADKESRRTNPDTEWELSSSAFFRITKELGQPDIDLFASRANAKCPRYISWRKDSDAIGIDAFTMNWSHDFFYAFPPFSEQTSTARAPYPGCRSAIQLAYDRRGLPTEAWELMLGSLAKRNPKICPATVLQDYISVTRKLRNDNTDRLLITVKRPHKNATAQSISRWLKQVLAESGVNVALFSGHSTRHAATSAAAAAGVSIEVIRKTAGWTSGSQTFAKFYNRRVISENNFARQVCGLTDDSCQVDS
ncbi:uncharacterized protein [Choristoneura fumiferana]|uniref:uncharacterized protein n=1 Tax=Choristoneura fumiferana TaxID=7141 RepID=UPI003D157378